MATYRKWKPGTLSERANKKKRFETLVEGKKNKASSVVKSRKRGNIQNKSTKRKKQKEKDSFSSSSSKEFKTNLSDESSEEYPSGSKNLSLVWWGTR